MSQTQPNVLPTEETLGIHNGQNTQIRLCPHCGEHFIVVYLNADNPEKETLCVVQTYQMEFGCSENMAILLSGEIPDMSAADMLREVRDLATKEDRAFDKLETAIFTEDVVVGHHLNELMEAVRNGLMDLPQTYLDNFSIRH